MRQKINGILLRRTKYQDNRNILSVYTLQHGLRSYIVTIGQSKRSRLKPGLLSPLNQLEFIEEARPLREIHTLSELSVGIVYESLYIDPVKSAQAVFINEVLIKTLREQDANKELYNFIAVKLKELDHAAPAPDFHLHFLVELSWFLGFYPNNTYSQKRCLFNLQEGVFTDEPPIHPYFSDSEVSYGISCLLTGEKANFTKKSRGEVLNQLLLFYRLHLPGFGELKSHAVLSEILS